MGNLAKLLANSASVVSSADTFSAGKRSALPKREAGFFAGLAVASILVPVHPSVQGILHQFGIPSAPLFLLLWLPILFRLVYDGSVRRNELFSVLPFAGYGLWLVLTSAYSPAAGLQNWVDSVRGIALILPCAIVAALIAAKEPKLSAKVIFICGFIALLHYSALFATGQTGGEGNSGFGAIATIDEVQNYQATSFYLGFSGIYLLAAYSVGLRSLWFVTAGLVVVLYLMGTVGARASMVGLLFVCFMVFASHRFRKITIGLLLAVPFAMVLVAILLSMRATGFDEIVSTLPVFERFSTLAGDDDSSHRVRLFSSAISLWLDSPATLLFGGGLGSFPIFTGQADEKGWYPHNFILETLAEGGLVALLFLIPPALVLLRRHVPIRDGSSFEKVFFFYISLYCLVSYMFMGGISTVWIPFFPWMITVLIRNSYE